jgi:hypothetical protein
MNAHECGGGLPRRNAARTDDEDVALAHSGLWGMPLSLTLPPQGEGIQELPSPSLLFPLSPAPLHKWRGEQIAPSPLGRDGERVKGGGNIRVSLAPFRGRGLG